MFHGVILMQFSPFIVFGCILMYCDIASSKPACTQAFTLTLFVYKSLKQYVDGAI